MTVDPSRPRNTFLFVSDRPDSAGKLAGTLHDAGKFVLGVKGVDEALSLLQRWSVDSILFDGDLNADPRMADLRKRAEGMNADLWSLSH